MRSYHTLAWKELKAQKVTSMLILIAIILSTLMTTVVGQSIGILQSLREQQASMLNGIRYATFHNLSDAQRDMLIKDERLSWAGNFIPLGSHKIKNSSLSIALTEFDNNSLSAYPSYSKLKSGKLPQQAKEIALSEETLKLLGFKGVIGDPITLDVSISLLQDMEQAYGYQPEFILSGILENNYLAYSSGIIMGIAGPGSSKALLPEKYQLNSVDFITASKSDFQQNLNQLADKINLRPENIQYNWVYLDALGISYNESSSQDQASGFSFMTVASILVGCLVLLAAGLVIYNILKIAVGKRIREYGCLRAIGAAPGQLYHLVTEQLVLLCGIGIPLGAIAGIYLSEGVTTAATSSLSPSIFLANSSEELSSLIAQNSSGKWLPLLVSALITLLFAFIAAIPAARYAAKVSPTVAMAGTTAQAKRSNRKQKRVHHFEAYLARLNMKRNTGRSVITILSLVMSITVFVAVNSFSGLLDTSSNVEKLHLGDYALTNETTGFAPEVIDSLRQREEVSYLSTVKYSLYERDQTGGFTQPIETNIELKQPFETLAILGIDKERLAALYPDLTDEQMQALLDGTACLIKNPKSMTIDGKVLEGTSIIPGDSITVAGQPLQVLANTEPISLTGDGFLNGVQIIVYDTTYDKLTGKDEYTEVYPKLTTGTDTEAFDKHLDSVSNETPGSHYISYTNTDQQLEESFQQIKLLAWGLILFIGLIGLLNIINTTYTNIHTRIGEIGTQRAIGMSKASLYKTFLWEGAYYGIIASIIGAITGYICTMFVEAATNNQLSLIAVPIGSILQAAVVSIIFCLLATCIPLRKISAMGIVESIETVE